MYLWAVMGGYACPEHANVWIEQTFRECVSTPWQAFAFAVGLSSMLFWLVAQLPQLISNFKHHSADALSPWFLLQWLAGDSFNFLGCIFTGDQLATQTLTATYFIFSDCVVLSQYMYYQIQNRTKYLDQCISDADDSLHKPRFGYKDVRNEPEASTHSPQNDSIIIQETPPQDSIVEQVRKGGSVLVTQSSLQNTKQHCASPFLHTDSRQHSKWMYEHQHRLRRVVLEYGLDYQQLPGSSRLNSANPLRNQLMGLRSPKLQTPTRKVQLKSVIGFVGLIALGSSSWRSLTSLNNMDASHVKRGISLGRKALKISVGNSYTGSVKLRSEIFTASEFLGRKLLSTNANAFLWTKEIGRSFGWASSGFYLCSRVSQLLQNHRRRSADGLSLGMFTCTVLANLTYGTSVLMRASSWEDLAGKAPWLLGSLGTVLLDIGIFVQVFYLSHFRRKGASDELTPLLF